jgi:hypothetical protein
MTESTQAATPAADLNTPHADKNTLTLQQAAEGYRRKHPTASDDEIADFVKMVSGRVTARYREKTNEREIRRSRIVAVAEKIKALNVHIATTRYCRPVDTDDEGTTYRVDPKGGLSAAYVYYDESNVTSVAISICNETDVFDRLEGRERSVWRFENGLVLTKPGKITDIDPLDLRIEYMQLLRDKGISEHYQDVKL